MLHAKEVYLYVGTYTGTLPHVRGKAKGIYVFRLNPETGEMAFASQNSAGVNPSYVTIDAQNRFLYAVDPTGKIMLVANQDTDTIVSYHIDQDKGVINPTGFVLDVLTPVCVLIVEF